jgi:hypothetical protein
VHTVLTSLLHHLPSIRAVLLNGAHSSRDEGALLHTGVLPAVPPSLLGLLPTVLAAGPVSDLRDIDFTPSSERFLLGHASSFSQCSSSHAPPFTAFSPAAGRPLCTDSRQHFLATDSTHSDGLSSCAVQIVVASPGRLVQHMLTLGTAWLRNLEFLVRSETPSWTFLGRGCC